MKLIKHKLIDGIKVFIGVENPAINTKLAIEAANKMIAEIPEQVEFDNKIKEGKRNAGKAVQYKKNFMVAYGNISQQIIAKDPKLNPTREMVLAAMTPETKKKLLDDETMYDNYVTRNIEVETDLKEIGGRLGVKAKDIRRSNTVYCDYEGHPEKMMVEDARASELLTVQAGKSKNQIIDIDGTVIDDFRGKEHNHKNEDGSWTIGKIAALGIRPPVDCVLTEDLTAEQNTEIHAQNETERISGLSVEDKAAELAGMVKGAMAQAINMRSELEILSDPDALVKPQEFYQGEVVRLEGVYG